MLDHRKPKSVVAYTLQVFTKTPEGPSSFTKVKKRDLTAGIMQYTRLYILQSMPSSWVILMTENFLARFLHSPIH